MKGSPTQVPQEPARAGIRVARTDDDSCQFVAPHALLSRATARETSGWKGEVVRGLRDVVVERSEEVGRPLRLHLRPIGKPGKDEKKRASPDYENANGHVGVQRDPSGRTDAAKVGTSSSMGQSTSVCTYSGWARHAQKGSLAVHPSQQQLRNPL